jgi:hypothetical protein
MRSGDSQTHIACTDSFNRERSVGIWTSPTRGRVVLVAPPAETALLTPTQARELGRHLTTLAAEVESEHHKSPTGQPIPATTPI